MRTFEFTLKDTEGNSHEYSGCLFSSQNGVKYLTACAKLFAVPAGMMSGAFLQSLQGFLIYIAKLLDNPEIVDRLTQDEKEGEARFRKIVSSIAGSGKRNIAQGVNDPRLFEILEDFDAIGMGEAVEQLFKRLEEEGGYDFIVKVMTAADLFRDGEKLNSTLQLEKAYGGNVFEMLGAFAYVIYHNYSPFLRGNSAVSSAWTQIRGLWQELTQPQTQTGSTGE